jgi:ribose transport system substrate-binding protein
VNGAVLTNRECLHPIHMERRPAMKKLKVIVSLITRDNDYQREQAATAEATAQRLGIDLQLLYAGNDAIAQGQQILTALRSSAGGRPDAVIVEPVGTGMPQVAKAATDNGTGWIVLNRDEEYLTPIRETSTAPIGSVDCDNVEVGRIQARQFAALLPSGGSLVYIEGPGTDASRQRRAGMEEILSGGITVQSIRGRWTRESAFQAFTSRLQTQSFSQQGIGIVGCQNDEMAMGAREAVEQLTDARLRAQWLKVLFTGCDGLPQTGQAWVQAHLLAATVVIPPLTGLALEMLMNAVTTGTQLPGRTLTKPTSYPPIEQLAEWALSRG